LNEKTTNYITLLAYDWVWAKIDIILMKKMRLKKTVGITLVKSTKTIY